MHPKDAIQEDLKAAMRAGDVQRREVRLLMAAFKQVGWTSARNSRQTPWRS